MNSEMNRLLREASGRHVYVRRAEAHAPVKTTPPRVGSIGIGLGAGSAARSSGEKTNAEVNRRLRAAVNVVRQASLREGISIDLDNPWA